MPYADMKDRDTYPAYDRTKKAKKARAARNQARAVMEREGKVSKGDGKDVDHKKPLSKGGTNKRSNLQVKPASANRTYKRGKNHSVA